MKNSYKILVLGFILVILAILFLVNQRPSFQSESLSAYTNKIKLVNPQIETVDYRMLNTTLYIKLRMKEFIEEKDQLQIVRELGDQLLKDRSFKELVTYYIENLKRPGINSLSIEFSMPNSKTKYAITIGKYLATSDSEIKYSIKTIESIDVKSGNVVLEEIY